MQPIKSAQMPAKAPAIGPNIIPERMIVRFSKLNLSASPTEIARNLPITILIATKIARQQRTFKFLS